MRCDFTSLGESGQHWFRVAWSQSKSETDGQDLACYFLLLREIMMKRCDPLFTRTIRRCLAYIARVEARRLYKDYAHVFPAGSRAGRAEPSRIIPEISGACRQLSVSIGMWLRRCRPRITQCDLFGKKYLGAKRISEPLCVWSDRP